MRPIIFRNPRHRTACLGLYKAYLTNSQHLPSPLQQIATNFIRKEFRRNRRVNCVKSAQKILLDAYEGERVLRQAATGDSSSIGSVQRRIDQILDLRKPNPPRTSVRPTTPAPPITLTRLEKARLKKQKRRAKRLQSSPEELPTRKVRKGPRIWHPGRLLTPLLASANGFPLLRHRGTPTPQHVAMTIKNLIKVRQKRQDLQDVLYEHLEYAHGEDTWDQEVFKHTGESGDEFIGPGEGTWADQVKASLRYLSDAIGRRDQRSKQLGDLFWDIEMRMIQKKERIIRARATERRKRARHSRGRRKNLAKQLKEEQIDG